MTEVERIARVGVIDVGSNSVRLVVFDGAARSPAYFYNEKVLCGLGAGLSETGKLNVTGRARAMRALHRFAVLLHNLELDKVSTVATAAVRDASDGPEFCAQVEAQTGLVLNVATGAEEARLSAQGVLLGWPDANGLVCDIGGASMELAELKDGKVGDCVTSKLGPLILQDVQGDLEAHITGIITDLRRKMPANAARLYLVGGSWRALARLDMVRQEYPLKVLHEYQMFPEQLRKTAEWVAAQEPEALAELVDTSMARLNLVPLAAQVLLKLIEVFAPEQIAISSYGIREGMLFEEMCLETRSLDPLIEACRFTEETNARAPGFGDALYHWLLPLYEGRDAAFKRLMLAACLLHDATWRAHPDYRADMCFETVTRANMGAIDHQGRLFLALAIRNRYSSGGKDSHPALALLDEDSASDAQALGRAMRLGAMISGALAAPLENTALTRDGDVLTLTLEGAAKDLAGEIVEKRLTALAGTLGCTAEIVRN